MKSLIKALWVGTLLVITAPVYAKSCGIHDHIRRVEQQIDRGIERGSLTRHEVRWLEQQRREIKALALDLLDDGHMSRKDCSVLINRIDRLSDRITATQRNDWRTDYGYSNRHHRRFRR